MAAYLDADAGRDELVVFYNPDPWVSPGMWYMGCKYYSPDANRPWLLLVQPADDQLMQGLGVFNSLWLLTRSPGDSATVLPGWWPSGAEFDTSECSVCRMVRSHGR
jgi:hypothetical protein